MQQGRGDMNKSKSSQNEALGTEAPKSLELVKGDYVLATKYSDGDPHDHWCVGYYAGVTAPHYNPPRFDVVDGEGNQFRGNGFRRVEKIDPERGAWMLKQARDIESSGMSVWHFATCPVGEASQNETLGTEAPRASTENPFPVANCEERLSEPEALSSSADKIQQKMRPLVVKTIGTVDLVELAMGWLRYQALRSVAEPNFDERVDMLLVEKEGL